MSKISSSKKKKKTQTIKHMQTNEKLYTIDIIKAVTKHFINKCSKMLSKVHFDGGLIEFFECTEPTGKFFHRFLNFNQL